MRVISPIVRGINFDDTVQRDDVEYVMDLGRGRTDLLVVWPHPGGVQQAVIELKIRYDELEQTIANGLRQTWRYMDRCGTTEGHLVIFDRAKKKSCGRNGMRGGAGDHRVGNVNVGRIAIPTYIL